MSDDTNGASTIGPVVVDDPVSQRAQTLLDGERVHDALEYLQDQGEPQNLSVEAAIVLVSAYRLTGHYSDSLELLRALDHMGHCTEVQTRRLRFEEACLYAQNGDFEQASGIYSELLSQVPDQPRCLGNLHQIALEVCDWAFAKRIEQRLVAIANNPNAVGRYYAFRALHKFTIHDDDAAVLAMNRLRAQHVVQGICHEPQRGEAAPRPNERLRIGYLGEPFRDHARAHLLTGVLEHHDREQFHVTAFGTGYDDGSAARQRLVQAVDVYRDLHQATDQAVAQQIAEDRIDVLIVTDGWNQGHRMAAISDRPAPIQIGYLGNPCSSGAEFLDYAIVDDQIAPKDATGNFSERLIRLSGTYQATDNRQPFPSYPADNEARQGLREQHGLPREGTVFASFNQGYKFTQQTILLWFDILKAVPDSVLWLLEPHPQAMVNLRKAAEAAGLEPGQLVFAPKVGKAEHINRLALADVALDPLTCNGHTTTTDALWAGVPVVALYGRHFASRVAASLLQAVGCHELVAQDIPGYLKRAVRLAIDTEYREALHQQLVTNRMTCRLFDTATHTQLLEQAYRQVYDRALAGKPPDNITIC